MTPRYPIYVPSKGRADACLTGRMFVKDGVSFKLVVEPTERDLYAREFGDERLLVLPFSDLGQGSIPARNWIKDHAASSGATRYWCVDDNIKWVCRFYRRGTKIQCPAGPAFAAVEDFVDRYENVAIAGLNYKFFAPRGTPPYFLNVHVYSCMLLQSGMPYRWRGRYNEDTDLCLQVLSAGLCTVLFNAFLVNKMPTMTMTGGNTSELYRGDGRLKMSRSLERAWPGVVSTTRKFKRPQHHVRDSWQKFDTPLKRRADVDFDALDRSNEYGLTLKQVSEIKSPVLRDLFDDWTGSSSAKQSGS